MFAPSTSCTAVHYRSCYGDEPECGDGSRRNNENFSFEEPPNTPSDQPRENVSTTFFSEDELSTKKKKKYSLYCEKLGNCYGCHWDEIEEITAVKDPRREGKKDEK